jgi:hypothetical protein
MRQRTLISRVKSDIEDFLVHLIGIEVNWTSLAWHVQVREEGEECPEFRTGDEIPAWEEQCPNGKRIVQL